MFGIGAHIGHVVPAALALRGRRRRHLHGESFAGLDDRRRGLLALLPPIGGLPLAQVTLPPDPLVLLCEGIEKPGNLGAMLRTADAAGIDLVVAVDPVTDWGNPNVVRGSKATVFSVPVASATRRTALASHSGAAY